LSFFSFFRQNSGVAIALPPLEEGTMHIHGNSMSVNAADFYSAAQNRAATAQRAVEVRKKLLKSASEIEGAAIPDESLDGFAAKSGSEPASESDSGPNRGSATVPHQHRRQGLGLRLRLEFECASGKTRRSLASGPQEGRMPHPFGYAQGRLSPLSS
jgi:hypothetical protein